MTQKVEKKFPRNAVIDRQQDRTRKLLELDETSQEAVRGGSAKYGQPPPDRDIEFDKIIKSQP